MSLLAYLDISAGSGKQFERIMVEEFKKALASADLEPQSIFIARVLNEDSGWESVRVHAANEDEVRAQFDGPVAGVHKL